MTNLFIGRMHPSSCSRSFLVLRLLIIFLVQIRFGSGGGVLCVGGVLRFNLFLLLIAFVPSRLIAIHFRVSIDVSILEVLFVHREHHLDFLRQLQCARFERFDNLFSFLVDDWSLAVRLRMPGQDVVVQNVDVPVRE